MTAAAYREQLQALLPRGGAWPREAEATLTRLLDALAEELARVDLRGEALATEADPRATSELLPDWERVAALPEPGTVPPATLQGRRAVLAAKVAGLGGQSPAYFIAVAQTLGYQVTISEFGVFRVGSRAGDSLGDETSVHVWRVNASAATVRTFKAGRSKAGEPLRSWGNELLEAFIRRLAPAHTQVLFGYGE